MNADEQQYDQSNSGDVHQERPLPVVQRGQLPQAERTYKITPPEGLPLEVLQYVALDHYSLRVETGLLLRHFDFRRN